eukprot:TRINITY_DN485_c0_g1_i1.p1 TRINITY_DN485_c0_g1~~TRINITY_DN485_c0_g1_i1.p1  ORF type:complete len:2394 (-),score=103.81 TRINITY_DN485_c0_g1_i1:361-7542(-)
MDDLIDHLHVGHDQVNAALRKALVDLRTVLVTPSVRDRAVRTNSNSDSATVRATGLPADGSENAAHLSSGSVSHLVTLAFGRLQAEIDIIFKKHVIGPFTGALPPIDGEPIDVFCLGGSDSRSQAGNGNKVNNQDDVGVSTKEAEGDETVCDVDSSTVPGFCGPGAVGPVADADGCQRGEAVTGMVDDDCDRSLRSSSLERNSERMTDTGRSCRPTDSVGEDFGVRAAAPQPRITTGFSAGTMRARDANMDVAADIDKPSFLTSGERQGVVTPGSRVVSRCRPRSLEALRMDAVELREVIERLIFAHGATAPPVDVAIVEQDELHTFSRDCASNAAIVSKDATFHASSDSKVPITTPSSLQCGNVRSNGLGVGATTSGSPTELGVVGALRRAAVIAEHVMDVAVSAANADAAVATARRDAQTAETRAALSHQRLVSERKQRQSMAMNAAKLRKANFALLQRIAALQEAVDLIRGRHERLVRTMTYVRGRLVEDSVVLRSTLRKIVSETAAVFSLNYSTGGSQNHNGGGSGGSVTGSNHAGLHAPLSAAIAALGPVEHSGHRFTGPVPSLPGSGLSNPATYPGLAVDGGPGSVGSPRPAGGSVRPGSDVSSGDRLQVSSGQIRDKEREKGSSRRMVNGLGGRSAGTGASDRDDDAMSHRTRHSDVARLLSDRPAPQLSVAPSSAVGNSRIVGQGMAGASSVGATIQTNTCVAKVVQDTLGGDVEKFTAADFEETFRVLSYAIAEDVRRTASALAAVASGTSSAGAQAGSFVADTAAAAAAAAATAGRFGADGHGVGASSSSSSSGSSVVESSAPIRDAAVGHVAAAPRRSIFGQRRHTSARAAGIIRSSAGVEFEAANLKGRSHAAVGNNSSGLKWGAGVIRGGPTTGQTSLVDGAPLPPNVAKVVATVTQRAASDVARAAAERDSARQTVVLVRRALDDANAQTAKLDQERDELVCVVNTLQEQLHQKELHIKTLRAEFHSKDGGVVGSAMHHGIISGTTPEAAGNASAAVGDRLPRNDSIATSISLAVSADGEAQAAMAVSAKHVGDIRGIHLAPTKGSTAGDGAATAPTSTRGPDGVSVATLGTPPVSAVNKSTGAGIATARTGAVGPGHNAPVAQAASGGGGLSGPVKRRTDVGDGFSIFGLRADAAEFESLTGIEDADTLVDLVAEARTRCGIIVTEALAELKDLRRLVGERSRELARVAAQRAQQELSVVEQSVKLEHAEKRGAELDHVVTEAVALREKCTLLETQAAVAEAAHDRIHADLQAARLQLRQLHRQLRMAQVRNTRGETSNAGGSGNPGGRASTKRVSDAGVGVNMTGEGRRRMSRGSVGSHQWGAVGAAGSVSAYSLGGGVGYRGMVASGIYANVRGIAGGAVSFPDGRESTAASRYRGQATNHDQDRDRHLETASGLDWRVVGHVDGGIADGGVGRGRALSRSGASDEAEGQQRYHDGFRDGYAAAIQRVGGSSANGISSPFVSFGAVGAPGPVASGSPSVAGGGTTLTDLRRGGEFDRDIPRDRESRVGTWAAERDRLAPAGANPAREGDQWARKAPSRDLGSEGGQSLSPPVTGCSRIPGFGGTGRGGALSAALRHTSGMRSTSSPLSSAVHVPTASSAARPPVGAAVPSIPGGAPTNQAAESGGGSAVATPSNDARELPPSKQGVTVKHVGAGSPPHEAVTASVTKGPAERQVAKGRDVRGPPVSGVGADVPPSRRTGHRSSAGAVDTMDRKPARTRTNPLVSAEGKTREGIGADGVGGQKAGTAQQSVVCAVCSNPESAVARARHELQRVSEALARADLDAARSHASARHARHLAKEAAGDAAAALSRAAQAEGDVASLTMALAESDRQCAHLAVEVRRQARLLSVGPFGTAQNRELRASDTAHDCVVKAALSARMLTDSGIGGFQRTNSAPVPADSGVDIKGPVVGDVMPGTAAGGSNSLHSSLPGTPAPGSPNTGTAVAGAYGVGSSIPTSHIPLLREIAVERSAAAAASRRLAAALIDLATLRRVVAARRGAAAADDTRRANAYKKRASGSSLPGDGPAERDSTTLMRGADLSATSGVRQSHLAGTTDDDRPFTLWRDVACQCPEDLADSPGASITPAAGVAVGTAAVAVVSPIPLGGGVGAGLGYGGRGRQKEKSDRTALIGANSPPDPERDMSFVVRRLALAGVLPAPIYPGISPEFLALARDALNATDGIALTASVVQTLPVAEGAAVETHPKTGRSIVSMPRLPTGSLRHPPAAAGGGAAGVASLRLAAGGEGSSLRVLNRPLSARSGVMPTTSHMACAARTAPVLQHTTVTSAQEASAASRLTVVHTPAGAEMHGVGTSPENVGLWLHCAARVASPFDALPSSRGLSQPGSRQSHARVTPVDATIGRTSAAIGTRTSSGSWVYRRR